MPDLINPRAERVKSVKALSGRSVRSRVGQFVIEGPQGVREAVRFIPGQIRDIYFTEPAHERYSEIVADAEAANLFISLVSAEVMAAMSPDAQGVLAVATIREARLDDVLAARPRLIALLSNVRDPGNAGTVIRAADAAGADAVILTTSSVDIFNPKTVRSTAGSLFHLPVVAGLDLEEIVAALGAHGVRVLAADGSGDYDLDELLDLVPVPASEASSDASTTAGAAPGTTSAPATDATSAASAAHGAATAPNLAAPTAWLFGNEAWGLRPEELALADASVRVPIRGAAESLNLATAATVCLYASSRAQR